MNISIILGTRPEIIKMSPIIRYCEKEKIPYHIIHTGQHYDENMDKVFFKELELPEPKYNLLVGVHPYRKQMGKMIREIQEILKKEKATFSLVQGDTNTVLAGALASNKLGIPVGHHEAGLRSHDLTMLEEINRITTDHISDLLFTPTKDSLNNLHEEGIQDNKIYSTGNTIVDAVFQNLEIANRKVNILERLNLTKKNYILTTAHRAENVDNVKRLQGILSGLSLVQKHFQIPIIYPIHPRTKLRIKEFNLEVPKNIILIEPTSFLEFLQLEANSILNISDSGGVQEESCILKVPCVTIRENTERPETLKLGINILAGTDPNKILEKSKEMVNKEHKWENPFGDGTAGKKIIDIIVNKNESFI